MDSSNLFNYSSGLANNRMLSRIYKNCNSNGNYNIVNCLFTDILKLYDKKIIPSDIYNLCKNTRYYNTDNSNISEGVSTWQGMCKYKNGQIIICGTTLPSPKTGLGLLYFGNIQCNDVNQTNVVFNVPGAQYTSCYGPRYDIEKNEFTLVGSYNLPNNSNNYGFLFKGKLNDLTNPDNYVYGMQVIENQYNDTFVHSTDGNFAVGASGPSKTLISAFIYNISENKYTQYSFPNSQSTTIYGIVQNPDTSYTIVGGWSDSINTHGFITDMYYEGGNLTFLRETSVDIPGLIISHHEGISKTNNPNIYTLAGDGLGQNNKGLGYTCIVERIEIENKFIVKKTVNIDNYCQTNTVGITTVNSVLENTIVGYFVSNTGKMSFQCAIDWNNI